MKQLTHQIMMIRPAHFGFNDQTATNNAFQSTDTIKDPEQLKEVAKQEFDQMVSLFRSKGINVLVIEDTSAPVKPDAVFPNNWISFHENGALITYPMFAPNRRLERREDIIQTIGTKFEIKNRYSFEFYEDESEPLFLEGTGSMIFDRPNGIAYACLSERTDATLIDKFNVLIGTQSVGCVHIFGQKALSTGPSQCYHGLGRRFCGDMDGERSGHRIEWHTTARAPWPQGSREDIAAPCRSGAPLAAERV